MIEKGREHWRKVNHLQKSLMSYMGMEKVVDVQPDGIVLFEAHGQRFIIEPSGEVMSGGSGDRPNGQDSVVHAWEQATPEKRQEWLQKLHLPLQYRHKHWLDLRQGVQQVLTKDYFLGSGQVPATVKLPTFKYKGFEYTVDYRLKEFRRAEHGKVLEFVPFGSPKGQEMLAQMQTTVPYIANPKYEQAMTEIAKWYAKHWRKMTPEDFHPIARKYFPSDKELDDFTDYMEGEGGPEFSKILRLHGWKAGKAGPILPDIIPARGIPDELLFESYKVPPTAF